jgi:hypothetical protein
MWEPTAVNAAARYLAEDPAGVDSLMQATDQLAEDSRPAASRPWGTEYRRLRHGPWRIIYRLDADQQKLYIEHIGRSGK